MDKTILLVDDHAVVRQGLKSLFTQWGYRIVGEADSGEVAIQLNLEHRPNLIVMDLDMPGLGGLEALKRILLRQKNAKILVYSMHDDNIYALRAMQSGAKGYVVKSDDINVLLEAVDKVFRGERFIGRKVAEHLAIDLMNETNKPLEKLSPREFEVFRQLAAGQSLSAISLSLNISYKTVANIQTSIRQKLEIQTTASLVHLAIQLGVTHSKGPDAGK
ncbi:MAG: response regulator transcription factor [Methylotenera sp.]|uniref:response regulator n=1 Tax=Methylotenera sp. TaxID=2051956 RepID=UPI00178D59D1|nr:response regulator transcription factor [Methylotenera sp.]NOU25045.1 response regulator transcription factor [Methylotenera sp.]